jgi:hypothetical protein
MQAAAKAIEISDNRKTGKVSVTHASQSSCSDKCPFKKGGCYAEQSFQGFTTRKLNSADTDQSTLGIARAEAKAIDSLTGQRDLRVHVVGDCSDNASARLVAAAAERHMAKKGKKAWSYTHSWSDVARKAWGRVSVLASVETLADARKAMRRGYAVAMVVSRFGSRKASMLAPDVKGIPCPAQTTEGVTCTSCRLCWNDQSLLDRRAIVLFEAHGSGQAKIRKALG